jgi:mannose-1-phosphate guanylyltransferase/mannose-6-phosphate isomerase
MVSVVPVILSGGAGTRLWPCSVSMYPKQLLPLVSGKTTMLQETALRLDGMENISDEFLVICNEAHRFLVAEQLLEIGQKARIVLEPDGRNTAPAAALAAFLAAEADNDAVLLLAPADHVITDNGAFRQAVNEGLTAAVEGKLVTFGIVPTRAETGYGYVKASPDGARAVRVDSFVEKPDEITARQYVAGGKHFWNSGMFLFSAAKYLDELKAFAPEIYSACRKSIAGRSHDHDFVRPDKESFLDCPADSIDYAIMEKTESAMVVPLDAGWSDVGDFASLHDVRKSDDHGNTIDGDVIVHDCENLFIQAEDMLVTAVGVDDIIIIQTRNSVLVADKSSSTS